MHATPTSMPMFSGAVNPDLGNISWLLVVGYSEDWSFSIFFDCTEVLKCKLKSSALEWLHRRYNQQPSLWRGAWSWFCCERQVYKREFPPLFDFDCEYKNCNLGQFLWSGHQNIFPLTDCRYCTQTLNPWSCPNTSYRYNDKFEDTQSWDLDMITNLKFVYDINNPLVEKCFSDQITKIELAIKIKKRRKFSFINLMFTTKSTSCPSS